MKSGASNLKSEILNPKSEIPLAPPLPKGWRWVRLGEVCDVVGGSTPDSGNPDFWNGEIVWITPTDLGCNVGVFVEDSARKITRSGYQSCGTNIVPAGSVILSSRAPIGHLAIAGVPLCTNQGCKSFVVKPEVDSLFLYYSLRKAVPTLQNLGSGATFKEISKSALCEFQIAIPPLSEQKRIAAILKEQLAAVDKARAAAQARLEAVKDLPAAFLRQVFPQPGAALPKGWRWVKLGEVCDFLDSRRIPVNEKERNQRIAGKSKDQLFPYYGANGQIGWIDGFLFDEPLILLAEDGGFFGSPETPIAYAVRGRYWVNNHAHVLRPKENIIDFDFCLRALAIRPDVGAMVTGNTRPKLNQKLAASIPMPLPPLADQKRIATILSDQFDFAERVRVNATNELATINALPASLLRRAFSGEL